MGKIATVIAAGLSLVAAGAASAATVNDLVSEGYSVVSNTTVTGDFNGCERDLSIQLDDGMTFVCSGSGYMFAHSPKVVVLRSKDGRRCKLLVNGKTFDGQLG